MTLIVLIVRQIQSKSKMSETIYFLESVAAVANKSQNFHLVATASVNHTEEMEFLLR